MIGKKKIFKAIIGVYAITAAAAMAANNGPITVTDMVIRSIGNLAAPVVTWTASELTPSTQKNAEIGTLQLQNKTDLNAGLNDRAWCVWDPNADPNGYLVLKNSAGGMIFVYLKTTQGGSSWSKIGTNVKEGLCSDDGKITATVRWNGDSQPPVGEYKTTLYSQISEP
ncbi:hypothetical protein KVR50_002854 [Salmonella enterica]|nr:hypothetical protein [Salmonella enterica]